MSGGVTTAAIVAVALAAPSLVTATMELLHEDPTLRPLGVTEARIAEAEIQMNDPFVRIRIFWRGPASGYTVPEDLADDLRIAFEIKGIDAMVAILRPAPGGITTIDMRAGRSVFGPFPVAHAAAKVGPAVQAARIAKRDLAGRR